MKCPKCFQLTVHRSRPRTGWEEFITTTLPYRYYRCHKCDWRELRKKSGPPAPALRPRRMRRVMFYVKLIGIIAALSIVGYLLIAPYMNMAKPVSRHQK
jgi:hypothetical protein